ncbi:MAG: 50S ribosomal protein L32 [Candidatus Paceibacterota bacterium]|jgi:ribosomal protein L32
MRATRSARNNRRSHHALTNPAISKQDGVVHLRHRASALTGKYKNLVVIDVEKKLAKRAKKAKDAASAR